METMWICQIDTYTPKKKDFVMSESHVFATKEEASEYGRMVSYHLTNSEKERTLIYVGSVTKDDLLDDAFNEEIGGIDWTMNKGLSNVTDIL